MKQNAVVCQPGPALLFFLFRFEYLISGPKSYRDFRETGPCFFTIVSTFYRPKITRKGSLSNNDGNGYENFT